ncbi:MAG: hypothetical protein HC798_00200 [Polaribacter sp.]|nr:hypothetical protein [Polaribacter sp.]
MQNRQIAYNGSVTHFLKSCIENNLLNNGFIVHQFKRVANQERPTDEAIEKARTHIKSVKTIIDFTKKITKPQTKLDSAIVVLQKSSLPKYQDFLYKIKSG